MDHVTAQISARSGRKAHSMPALRAEEGKCGCEPRRRRRGERSPEAASGCRYVAVLDPMDRYAVFDDLHGVPAEVSGCALIGLSQLHAVLLCRLLNRGCAPSRTFLRTLGLGAQEAATPGLTS